MRRLAASVLVLVPALWLGCSDDASECTPGQVVSCPCPGGSTGVQTCLADGSGYGACEGCGGTGAAAGSGGSGGVSAGGGGAASGGQGGLGGAPGGGGSAPGGGGAMAGGGGAAPGGGGAAPGGGGVGGGVACPQGTGECDGDPATVCETDTTMNVGHCGWCWNVCPFGQNSYPVCDQGSCTIGCNTAFDNCDTLDSNGCEADLDHDPLNCESCGRDCDGGACDGALCQPVVLAYGQAVQSMAVDGTDVFWTGGTAVQKVPIAGGTPTELWSGDSTQPLVIDSTHVYWGAGTTNDSSLHRSLKDGTGHQILVSGESFLRSIAVDATHVFWTNNNGELRKITKTGSGLQTVVSGATATEFMVVDATHVFWIAEGAPPPLWKVAKDGTGQQQLVASVGYWTAGLALDASNVFWTVSGGPPATAGVWTIGKDGIGLAHLDMPMYPGVGALAVDGGYVYWLEGDWTRRIPTGGGVSDIVAPGFGGSEVIALDPTHVFYPYMGVHLAKAVRD